jgi:hypothetical protein
MPGDLVVRFVVGGIIVSAFAALANAIKPKSFAGIFGAAPSVALASLTLAFIDEGGDFVALAGRSMAAGAVALLVYSLTAYWLLSREWAPTAALAAVSWVSWLVVAIGLWGALLR